MIKHELIRLKLKLLGIKPKPKFLTIKEIQEIMRNGGDMPTAIFSAEKRDYIVKDRTIYGSRKKSKGRIRM